VRVGRQPEGDQYCREEQQGGRSLYSTGVETGIGQNINGLLHIFFLHLVLGFFTKSLKLLYISFKAQK